MTKDFEVGEFDLEVVENWGRANETGCLESGDDNDCDCGGSGQFWAK